MRPSPCFWIALVLVVFWVCLGFWLKSAWGEEVIDWDKLVYAVTEVESGGDAGAYNESSGCVGLMQINPKGALAEWNEVHAKKLAIYLGETITPTKKTKYDLYDARFNTEVGTWYLKRLHYHYGMETLQEIACAYNWGVTNVRKKGLKHAPRETREYYQKVKKLYEEGEWELTSKNQ